ncbi:YbhB/YbcL family Raf kinase inhibitor-like protein [Amycolatopsis acidicola]|uniref:YbhB/YbcL family Raf kinase inhibitor-like protein n=1 Tax=Amycolatopsis acidicola TaxID=2596893 RepID=A0A5N0V4S4_9PSEU|nr:YbhB/YbcL family Raf kinase inhibitor-like protein [Amycolatopsis acidicola]KAA9159059.1 YbhB/YbcL family Raf kinase inhibitor-like protein [Amycolatopsis acidicola]
MPVNPLGVALRNKRVGHEKLVWARPELRAPETFTLSSPAFEDGGAMPEQYRGRLFGHNTSPALDWTTPPGTAVELVLIVEDADSPFGNPNTHGLAAGIDPALGGIPVDGLTEAGRVTGVELGKAGPRHGWFGPMPIRSHGPHSYVFQLFALDRRLGLPGRFKLGAAVEAMAGHVVGRAKLEGTRENR